MKAVLRDDRPRMSVLLPVYSSERYLREALESIINQTLDDIEILVVDDGSEDSSPQIVEDIKDPRVRLFRRPHEGLVGALNFGLSKARARWVARMDADDVALPQRLARQFEFLQDHQDIAALGAAARVIDSEGNQTGQMSVPPERHEDLLDRLLYRQRGISLIHPTVVMNRRAVLECGGYRRQFKDCEDTDLWLRLSRKGLLHSLLEPLVLLRKHSESVSSVYRQSQVESHLAAAICQIVWSKKGCDVLEDYPEQWGFYQQRIRELLEQMRMKEMERSWETLKTELRSKSLGGILRSVKWLLVNPGAIKGYHSQKYYARIADQVAREALATLRTDRSG